MHMDPFYPSEHDRYLFHKGELFHAYRMLGAHLATNNGTFGVRFSVWAPNAQRVAVVGDFNQWDGRRHVMEKIEESGIWTLFVPECKVGDLYKYEILTPQGDIKLKSDPFAFYSEVRPCTASIVYDLDGYEWGDHAWLQRKKNPHREPMNIYEIHAGSWKRKADGSFYTYRELAAELVAYVTEMGYTHVEFLPLAEHPYDRSWGYQATGYYSITSRYGKPEDFMYLVDTLHQAGIGVILDWVPGHFCKDDHGLRRFDGTSLYEHHDMRIAEKTGWGTLSFDFGRPEVVSFLISNAIFWMEKYHVDGLRVDAVASMLYLDFDKRPGEWVPNCYGGHENLEAIAFLKKLNEEVFKRYPQALMMAEESTAWPMVSMPTDLGGLGFNFKWNMGWMNDMLRYMEMDPIHRKWHHHLLTFSLFYAFSENFILPFSHDEVVYGKRSILNKMPGDVWQKFASTRLLYGYMMAHPGKKLLFMGGEIGQFDEWNDERQVHWHLLDFPMHTKLQHYVKVLNALYKQETALWEFDHKPDGFEWIDPHDCTQSVVTFLRKSASGEILIAVCNFTPVVRHDYRIGVPEGSYVEVLNSDAEIYGGSGVYNKGVLRAEAEPWHNRPYSLRLVLPPLAIVLLKPIHEEVCEDAKKGMCSDDFSRGRRKTAGIVDGTFSETGCTFRWEIPNH
jgi:1,4-alpha-glucan branching enzyme